MLELWILKQVKDFKQDQNMWSFGVGESSLLENKLIDDSNSPPFLIKPVDKKISFIILLVAGLSQHANSQAWLPQ